MKIRLSFAHSIWMNSGLVEQHVLGYDLHQVVEALRDWWVLRRAGRHPRIWIERSR